VTRKGAFAIPRRGGCLNYVHSAQLCGESHRRTAWIGPWVVNLAAEPIRYGMRRLGMKFAVVR